MSGMVEILVVDDHPIVAEGLRKLLLASNIVSACIIANSFSECQKTLQVFTPDLVMLDYSLPDGNGADLCGIIKQKNANIKILAISSYRERSIINLMIDKGASGYILKNASENEIIDAVKTILAGKTYLYDDSYELKDNFNDIILTRREIEILQLIADGYTNTEIAEKIFISPSTVDSHRKNILLKFNARNTAALMRIAIRQGIIT